VGMMLSWVGFEVRADHRFLGWRSCGDQMTDRQMVMDSAYNPTLAEQHLANYDTLIYSTTDRPSDIRPNPGTYNGSESGFIVVAPGIRL